MENINVDAQSLLYIIKMNVHKIDNSQPEGAFSFLGVIEEEDDVVKCCVLEGSEYLNVPKGVVMGATKEMVESQINDGLAIIVKTDDYFISKEVEKDNEQD